jgi:hypothetical protein
MSRWKLTAALFLVFLAWTAWAVHQRLMLICFVRPLADGTQQIIVGHTSEWGVRTLTVRLKVPRGLGKRITASVDGGSLLSTAEGQAEEGQQELAWTTYDLRAKGALILKLDDADLKLIQNSELFMLAVKDGPWFMRVIERRIPVAALRRG